MSTSSGARTWGSDQTRPHEVDRHSTEKTRRRYDHIAPVYDLMEGMAQHRVMRGWREPPGAPPVSSEMTRRTFLTMLLSTTGVLGAAGLLAPIVRYAYPTVQAVAVAKQKVATTAQPAAGGGELNFDYQDTPSSLVKLEDGTYAGVSRVCTHLGCIIKWQGKDKRFFCPCHAGIFSPTGQVLGGPPPRPLAKLAVRVQGEDIWVDGWQPS